MLFSNLIGNQAAKDVLYSLIQSKRVPHALLFCGAAGVGKKQFALEFAKGLLGERHSRKIDSGHHPDIRIFSPEGKSGLHSMASIQQMISEMALEPFEADCRLFIIDEAERMLATSSNALLKTLEEPQAGNYIILISHQPEEILPTLLSRCRKIAFLPIPEKEITTLLKEKEGKTDAAARRIAFLSHGSLSKARSLLEEDKQDHKKSLLQELLSMNRLQECAVFSSLCGKIEQACLKKMESEEEPSFLLKEADVLFEEIFYWYRDLHLLECGAGLDYLFHFDALAALQSQLGQSLPSLEKVHKALDECRLAVQRSIKLKTVLEHFFLQIEQK